MPHTPAHAASGKSASGDVGDAQRLGQFFTPNWLADLLLAFCLRSPRDSVLDPSCGDGVFLRRAASRLRWMGARPSPNQLVGVEVDPDVAVRARQALTQSGCQRPRVLVRDFTQISPQDMGRSLFSAVVGNPPFIRHELIARRGGPGLAVKGDIPHPASGVHEGSVHLSGRSGSHVHFLVHAAGFVAPGGRLGFVMPNSWLDAAYGRELKRFMLQEFRLLAVVEPESERWFNLAAVNACLVVLERCVNRDAVHSGRVAFVQTRAPLRDLAAAGWPALDAFVDSILGGETPRHDGRLRCRAVPQPHISPEEKWGPYLRAPDVYFRVLRQADSTLRPLGSLPQVAGVRYALKTGANEWFYMRRSKAEELGLEPHLLRPVVRSPRQCAGIRVEAGDLTDVAVVVDDRQRIDGTRLQAWIEEGERRGYHTRVTCGARSPWYCLRPPAPAPILCPSTVHSRHICFLNPDGALADKRFYRLCLSTDEWPVAELLCALMNSSWWALATELSGRTNLGYGALDLTIDDLLKAPLPNPDRMPPFLRSTALAAFGELCGRPIGSVFAEANKQDRCRLDDAALTAMGFSVLAERRALCAQIRDALCELVRARISRASCAARDAPPPEDGPDC